MERALRLPWKMEVTELKKTLLAFILIPVIFATLTITTACPVSQTDLQKAEQVLSYVEAALPIALQFVATFSGAIPADVMTNIQKWSTVALSDAQLATQLLAQYANQAGTTVASKVNAALADAQANLGAILAALRVVDQKVQTSIGAVFAAVVSAVGTVETLIQTLLSKAATPNVKVAKARLKATANDFKSQFNNALTAGGHPELNLK